MAKRPAFFHCIKTQQGGVYTQICASVDISVVCMKIRCLTSSSIMALSEYIPSRQLSLSPHSHPFHPAFFVVHVLEEYLANLRERISETAHETEAHSKKKRRQHVGSSLEKDFHSG